VWLTAWEQVVSVEGSTASAMRTVRCTCLWLLGKDLGRQKQTSVPLSELEAWEDLRPERDTL